MTSIIRNRAGALLHALADIVSRFAFWVEVWRCDECGEYSNNPEPLDSFHYTCPKCGKVAPHHEPS